MKKSLRVMLGIGLAAAVLAGCGGKSETAATTAAAAASSAAETTAAAAESTAAAETKAAETTAAAETKAGGAKTGLAVLTSLGKSTPAADKDGLAEVDSTVIAVLVGEDGKILDCKIDGIQTKLNFNGEGKITGDLKAQIKTKQELGAEYGMKKASGIGKEWNEQADAFAAYVKGKTVDEVKGIAVNEKGDAADADLASSVTIGIKDFIAGVEKAVSTAQALGAADTDKLGLAIETDSSKSKDAAADAEGQVQAYTFYSAVTTDASGKITSCYIDASQGTVKFDTKGQITNDIKAEVQTKQELKEGYGMKKASGIGKEWYEQANAFAAYATGKTADEVKGIAVDGEGKTSEADLASSVTVHVAPLMSIVAKAVANAK